MRSPYTWATAAWVYRARDTRLDRIVAIKVSKAAFSERFDREAPAVATLNHPRICTVFDVGPDYLVMEFPGAVLRDRLHPPSIMYIVCIH